MKATYHAVVLGNTAIDMHIWEFAVQFQTAGSTLVQPGAWDRLDLDCLSVCVTICVCVCAERHVKVLLLAGSPHAL